MRVEKEAGRYHLAGIELKKSFFRRSRPRLTDSGEREIGGGLLIHPYRRPLVLRSWLPRPKFRGACATV